MARQIMCSCDSKNLYELRASGNTAVSISTAEIDETTFVPPGEASIKSPAGCKLRVNLVEGNDWAHQWWLKFYFKFKRTTQDLSTRPVISVANVYGTQCVFRLIPVDFAVCGIENAFTLTIFTGRKGSSGPETMEACCKVPICEDVWYEIILYVKHNYGDGKWGIWINGQDNVEACMDDLRFCRLPQLPTQRCNVCGGCPWEYGNQVMYTNYPWGAYSVPLMCPGAPNVASCEYPAYKDKGHPACCVVGSGDGFRCDSVADACYPRHQTRFGDDAFASILYFGTDEDGAAGFDYWYDDIMFNDTCPYKHDDPSVEDSAKNRQEFGGRLTVLKVIGAGAAAELTRKSVV